MHARRSTERRTSNEGGRRPALVLAGLALPFLVGFYALILGYWAHPASAGRQLRLDEFLTLVGKGQISSATILSGDDRISGGFDAGGRYWVDVDVAGGHESLFARLTGALEAGGVPTTVRRQPLKSLVAPVSTLLPVLILGDLIVVVTLLARSGAGPMGAFGKAGARRVGDGGPSQTLTFADVAGADEAVELGTHESVEGSAFDTGRSSRHVAAAFGDEEGARAAFRALRLGHAEPDDWAEVASFEPSGRLRRLCWFGTPVGLGGREASGSAFRAPADWAQARAKPALLGWRPGRHRHRFGPRLSVG